MEEDKKEVINARAAALRESEGITSQADHLLHYMRACKEVADGLTYDEILGYKASADKITQQCRQPPTLQMIYMYVLSLNNSILYLMFSLACKIAS
jgi:hypothetical protein